MQYVRACMADACRAPSISLASLRSGYRLISVSATIDCEQ